MSTPAPRLTRKDFQTDQEVRWCPGCGDYAILAAVQQALADLGTPRERIVVVSGIGCSSRFPYYLNTYGFHTIHGRAPAVATGVKVANPDLSVWVVTGDGDALSIGGNHLIHVLRRNVDVNILLFNNRIYGLTKGQFSPTSEAGKRTRSSPFGTPDRPFEPLALALGAEATFVARGVDVQAAHLREVLQRAHAHRGASLVEILQNCNIFNDEAWAHLTARGVREDNQLVLKQDQPLLFGRDLDRGLRLAGTRIEVVHRDVEGLDDVLVHDEKNRLQAYVLSRLGPPEFPTPIGVLLDVEAPTLESGLADQLARASAGNGSADIQALLESGDTWRVGG